MGSDQQAYYWGSQQLIPVVTFARKPFLAPKAWPLFWASMTPVINSVRMFT